MCTINAYTPLLAGDVTIAMNGSPTIYRCAPDWHWKPSPLADYDLWCVLDGRGTLHLGSGPTALLPGACCIIPPGTAPHATHLPATPLTVFAIHFTTSDDFVAPKEILVQLVADLALLSLLADRSERAAAANTAICLRQATSLVRELMLLLLVESRMPSRSVVDERVAELFAAIRREPGMRWRVDEMAAKACLSRSQLTRVAERETGMPPMEFVIHCRLERARQILLETRKSIAEVADALGYDDVHYFSRQFKSRYGQSPRDYRSRAM